MLAPTVTRADYVPPVARTTHCACQAQPHYPETLPHELSSFVGSSEQIDVVAAHLPTARLITLTGAAGVGKTRLALQVARSVRAEHPSIAWTTLSSVVDGEHVASVVAATLAGGEHVSSIGVEALVSCIRDHKLLLVLDNCEHLVGACADVVLRLLQECAGIRIIATSREPLGVPGEIVYPVAPLALPEAGEPLEQQMQSDSVLLFLDRARARDPRIRLTLESSDMVARICRTLNGVPLAIELAAARTSSMSVFEIAQRLSDDPLGLLMVGARAAPPRQQTLRASIDWSHNLLHDAERRLFRRLAALDEGFLLQDAEAAGALEDTDASDIAFLLDRLVTQSLVHAEEKDATVRFSMIASVRQYAQERLDQAGEAPRVQARLHGRINWPAADQGARLMARATAGHTETSDTVPHPWTAPRAHADGTDDHLGPTRSRRRNTLSDRERAVVLLIAGGRSNREIAEELVITRKTAEAHVSHILTKLGLCSRVQIATWSLQQGLVPSAGPAPAMSW